MPVTRQTRLGRADHQDGAGRPRCRSLIQGQRCHRFARAAGRRRPQIRRRSSCLCRGRLRGARKPAYRPVHPSWVADGQWRGPAIVRHRRLARRSRGASAGQPSPPFGSQPCRRQPELQQMTMTRGLTADRRLSGKGRALCVWYHKPQPPAGSEASVSGIGDGALRRRKESSPRQAIDYGTDSQGR